MFGAIACSKVRMKAPLMCRPARPSGLPGEETSVETMSAPLRIGIVEDNDDLRESLVELLQGLGHSVVGFPCSEDLNGTPMAADLELLMLDLNLPGEDGLSLAARLKRVQPSLRVIMMTARTALADRVRGYDLGADLYLSKPVAEDELLAALRAMSRQIHADTLKAAQSVSALLHLDVASLQLRGRQGVASLTPPDICLLSALARAPGQRLEHWQLIEALGLQVDESTRANLSVRMTRLRAKLDQAGGPTGALKSLRATGYQLCVPLEIR